MFASWVQPGSSTPAAAPLICVALAFCALFVLQSTIALAPQGTLARGLYPWFYGGLFLDEKFNRAAFAVWRPPLPVAAAALLPATDTTTALKNTTTSAGVRT